MTYLRRTVIIVSFLVFSDFAFAQNAHHFAPEENHLMNLYHQWSQVYSDKKNFSAGNVGARIATSNFYPLKATNYNWNNTTLAWDIFDTTLYTYAGANLISTITRKDASNNFLTRVLNSYDASNNLIEAIHQNWSSGWANNYRDTFAFDSYNNIITHEYQTWGGTQWTTAAGNNYINTYSGTGKILVQISQTWNGTAWDTISRFTNTYNGNDQVTQTVRESWSGSWNNTSKTDYTYDASNVNTQTVDYSWSGSTWNNNAQIINPVWAVWTGDIATSKPSSYTYQTWSGSAWINSERLLSATYDSFGGSVDTYQHFVSGIWVNESLNSIFFDAQYNKTGKRDESWNTATASWDTTYEYKYLFTYDGNNSITQSIYQEFDGTSHSYLNYYKTDYGDFLFLDVNEVDSPEKISVSFYPNPMTEFADVIVSSDNFTSHSYQIYDLHGCLILSEQIKGNHFRLNKNNFLSGMYMLRISDSSGKISSLKFIVQ